MTQHDDDMVKLTMYCTAGERRQLKTILAEQGKTLTGWFQEMMAELFEEASKRKDRHGHG
jgi:hypothetical protein